MASPCVAVIDLKAFYAAVECIDRHLDMFSTPLVVCDKSRGPGTIVLSVSPYLKALGVPSRCRAYELPAMDNIIYATPRMHHYLDVSAQFIRVLLDFVGEDDLHVYSVDEAFINIGPYLKLYQMTPLELISKILKTIYERLKLVATAGIGPNPFIAKCALDLDAKKQPDFMAQWTSEDIPTKLWPLTPLSKLWGISSGYERKLNNIGIMSVGDLANYPKDKLRQYFGVMGEQLWEHANGIDDSNIRDKYIAKEHGLTIGQVLFRDYHIDEVPLIIREMSDDLSMRLRLEQKLSGLVSLMVGYSDTLGGFSRQMSLQYPTDDEDILYDALMSIFYKHKENQPVRRLSLSFSKFVGRNFEQLNLFIDPEEQDKKRRLQYMVDLIHHRFGMNALIRATALMDGSTAMSRHQQIGGHRR